MIEKIDHIGTPDEIAGFRGSDNARTLAILNLCNRLRIQSMFATYS